MSSRCTASFNLSGGGLPESGEEEFCSLSELSPSAASPELASLSTEFPGLLSPDRLLVRWMLLSADTGRSRTVRVRLECTRLSSEPDCGRLSAVRVDDFLGGPAGVAFAQARMLARVGPP